MPPPRQPDRSYTPTVAFGPYVDKPSLTKDRLPSSGGGPSLRRRFEAVDEPVEALLHLPVHDRSEDKGKWPTLWFQSTMFGESANTAHTLDRGASTVRLIVTFLIGIPLR